MLIINSIYPLCWLSSTYRYSLTFYGIKGLASQLGVKLSGTPTAHVVSLIWLVVFTVDWSACNIWHDLIDLSCLHGPEIPWMLLCLALGCNGFGSSYVLWVRCCWVGSWALLCTKSFEGRQSKLKTTLSTWWRSTPTCVRTMWHQSSLIVIFLPSVSPKSFGKVFHLKGLQFLHILQLFLRAPFLSISPSFSHPSNLLQPIKHYVCGAGARLTHHKHAFYLVLSMITNKRCQMMLEGTLGT